MSLLAARIAFWAKRHDLEAKWVLEFWNERAAIREHLGGFSRADAEEIAFERDVVEWFAPSELPVPSLE